MDDDNGVPPEYERTPFWVSLGAGHGFRVATRDDLAEAGWITRSEADESVYWLLDRLTDEAKEELRKAAAIARRFPSLLR